MSAPVPAPPATRRPGTHVRSFLAFVTTTEGAPEIRVRYRESAEGWRWSCDTCGQRREPTCPHAQAAHYLTAPASAEATTTQHDN
ncbi:hypothetical protein [Pengzhenrongella frigida]|uniref:SWIM-type domain-containing protein n=1 Tax=Pengzhenrongella frigida TaxID=1259133 RepID=A0A4Q5MYB6_9MICO|nr:hypothetical protein [Cellulomonas sp. HLT2-17]RYV50636.1 hypothetical protein EUA98_12320 [Cellulomonas sp. HLT2-17]